ncbi:MAG TPA: efflux RND transporter periplasmic adaptor subunit [Candidatus Binataceae bacterium]|nr:efflux RND transporter periplasmic adaptor subunit [Candidatus Binataceae bacterium]
MIERRVWLRLKRYALAAASLLVILFATLSGCGGGYGGSADDDAAPDQTAVVMAVSGARVTIAPLRQELRLLGTTVARRHVTLRAPAAGRIMGFDLRVGEPVRKGATVARVINREVEAAASGLAVAQSIDRADAPALAAALKRNLPSAAITVTAPEDGVVAQPLVSNGQMVTALDPLADLIDPRSVYVEAAVPVSELAAVRPGMAAVVVSPIHPGRSLDARVAAISPSFSPGGATAPARIEFAGPERIAEVGAPAEVSVTTAVVPAAIVIPSSALFEDATHGTWYVFVAGADGRAHRTTVALGIRDGDRTQVIAGVSAGAIVITSGGYALADGLRVHVTQSQG